MSPRMTLAAVVIAGMTAGVVVSPVFLVATLVVAVLLANGFTNDNASALVANEWTAFSPSVGQRLADSLATLPGGEARRLLLEIGVRGRSLIGSSSSVLDAAHERATREHVERLVEACCGTALELSQLDDALAVDRADVGSVKPDATTRDRIVSARVLLHTRLTNASDALRQLYAAGLTSSSAASERVAELTNELTADANARRAALAELSKLLDAAAKR